MKEKASPKQKKQRLAIAIVCLLLAGGGILWMLSKDGGSSLALDDNATMGVLPGIDMAERQAQLQEQLDEGMIAFSINSSPVFADGGAEGNLMLENPEHNAKLLVAEIYLDDTQELIYQSKAIPAGAYIENAMLDKVLEPGEYQATAYFKAYREDDRSFIGQAGAAIKITVLS